MEFLLIQHLKYPLLKQILERSFITQLAIAFSKLTIETVEQGVKYVQS